MEADIVASKVHGDIRKLARNFGHWIKTYVSEDGRLLLFAQVLRLAFLVEVITRPFLRSQQAAPRHMQGWWFTVIGFAVYTTILLAFCFRFQHDRMLLISARSKIIQVIGDTTFSGLFYFFNGNPESNLVLTFSLPIVMAARYFSIKQTFVVSGVVLLVIAGTLIEANQYAQTTTTSYTLLRIFVIRATLFIIIAGALVRAVYLNRKLKYQAHAYRHRMDLLVKCVKTVQRQNMHSLFAEATKTARIELHAEAVSLFLYEHGAFRRLKSSGIDDQWFADEQYAPGEGITGKVGVGQGGSLFGEPTSDNHVGTSTEVNRDHLARYQEKLKSGAVRHLVAVPLDDANQTFGILRAVNKLTENGALDPSGFTLEDQDILSSIAALVALGYASLRREKRVETMLEVIGASSATFDEQQVCKNIAAIIVELGYSACCVRLREATDRLCIQALHGVAAHDVATFHDLQMPQPELLRVLHSGKPHAVINLQDEQCSPVVSWARRLQFHSVLYVPLVQQQHMIGTIEIYTHVPHSFYKEEIHTLGVFAAKATMAIINARLSKQNHDQIRRLKMLADTINSITACTDHAMLFDRVAHKAAALLNAEDCSIFWVHREHQTIDLKASHCIPRALFKRRVAPVSAQPKTGLPSYVAATAQPLYFIGDEYKTHPAWNGEFTEHLDYLPSKRCASLMMYPIGTAPANVYGVIRVENKIGARQHEGFTEADRELLELLARQIVIAAEKIDQIYKLERLHRVAQSITAMGEPRDVLHQIAVSAVEVVPADLAVICPYDADTGELIVAHTATAGQRTAAQIDAKPRDHGILQELLLSKDGCVVVPDLNHAPEKANTFTEREGIRSLIAVLLNVSNCPVGILYCDFRQPRQFLQEQIANARAFGELAAIAIHNANMLTREQRTVQELSVVQQLTRTALEEIEVERVLNVVVETICATLGFDLCTVSLVDESARIIETRAAHGIPDQAWVEQARHNLDSSDIQACVVNTGETVVISGYDERLDARMYQRFGHERLVRVFMPIRVRDRIIGTVEAGYDRGHKATIAKRETDMLKRYLEPVALVIEGARLLDQTRQHAVQLHRLHDVSQQMDRALSQKNIAWMLQLATDGVATVLGPQVLVAIYMRDEQPGKLLLQAYSGRDASSFAEHTRFLSTEYADTLSLTEPLIHEGRYAPQERVPCVYVPIRIGGEAVGVLCIAYNCDHWFTENERKVIDLCANQAAIAISIAQMNQQQDRRLNCLSDDIEQSYHSAIGQPIVTAIAHLDNLLDERSPLGQHTPQQRDRLYKAQQALTRLQRQIRRLLLARRLEEDGLVLETHATDACALVRTAVRRVRPVVKEKRIRITCTLDKTIGRLQLDESRIEEVLVDLLLNASKFTEPGGAIHVRAEHHQHAVRISIRDTGRGIAPEYVESIFEKYVQIPPLLSNHETGTGLGLYLARKLMERHRGSIDVESQPGQGSTFTLVFPQPE